MRRYLSVGHYVEFRAGSLAVSPEKYRIEDIAINKAARFSLKFRIFKFAVDCGCALLAVPIILGLSVVLLVVNPFANPGPVFFTQSRVGRFGRQFRMWKFRTMVPSNIEARDPNAKLEEDRITRFGRFMRRSRIDELPNFFNVLRGEMSVVGPRPDAVNHAEHYSGSIMGYSYRTRVKPGITGLAQVEQGYVEDADATALKAKYDNIYVHRLCGRLDLYIILRTFWVMVKGFGAK